MAFWKKQQPGGDGEQPRDQGEQEKKGGFRQMMQGVLYGMASHGNVTAALRTRMHLEHLFMFITLGDMLGIPVLPPYYSLRILPYAVPNIESWKRRVFRERDFTDAIY